MKELVNVQIYTNEEMVIDSREVAEMLEKRHADLLRTIDNYVGVLTDAKLRSLDFFIKDEYLDGKGEKRPCYLLTRQGCEMIANKARCGDIYYRNRI